MCSRTRTSTQVAQQKQAITLSRIQSTVNRHAVALHRTTRVYQDSWAQVLPKVATLQTDPRRMHVRVNKSSRSTLFLYITSFLSHSRLIENFLCFKLRGHTTPILSLSFLHFHWNPTTSHSAALVFLVFFIYLELVFKERNSQTHWFSLDSGNLKVLWIVSELLVKELVKEPESF